MHCLFSFVMDNSSFKQLEFWACPTILGELDFCFVSFGTHGLHCLSSFVIEIFSSRQKGFSACPIFLNQLHCFIRHAWFALAVFSRDGMFLLDAVGILSLSNYSWTIRLQIVSLSTYNMYCENFCPRQLEFWACPYILDQLDCFVRHAWFPLSVFSCDEKFMLEAIFWGYPIILGQLDRILLCLVMETFCRRHLEF